MLFKNIWQSDLSFVLYWTIREYSPQNTLCVLNDLLLFHTTEVCEQMQRVVLNFEENMYYIFRAH
jgi:hypothetical protein